MFVGFLLFITVLNAALFVDGSHLLERRSPSMGFMGLRGKKDELVEDQLAKRGTNTLGFSGMRGKKDMQASDEVMDLDDVQLFEKRGPSSSLGFNGMRGKKAADAEAGDLYDKRARNTLGFSGLRGKKASLLADDDEDAGGGQLAEKRAQRNTLGFSGMRGKKSQDYDLFGQEEEKRARNTLGFSGMRGKKSEDDFEEVKRGGANSLGFSGMRGKKDPSPGSVLALGNPMLDYGKRARSMSGFVGMRGRRDFWDDDSSGVDKRAPSGQAFMGMRGKRPEVEAIPDLAQPQDDAAEALGYLFSPEAAREGIVTFRSKRFLPVNYWPLRNSKKAPFSGFIGMRGKKSLYRPASAVEGPRSGGFMSGDFDQ